MKKLLRKIDVMEEYTQLVKEIIDTGRLLKGVGGGNSMYEYSTHFQPTSEEFSHLIVALERAKGADELDDYRLVSSVTPFDLVVKNIKTTFDDGEVLYTKRLYKYNVYGKVFYLTDIEDVKVIEEKRRERWSRLRKGPNKKIKVTQSFVDKLRKHRGFTNAKAEEVEVYRTRDLGYKVINKGLKTEPTLDFTLYK